MYFQTDGVLDDEPDDRLWDDMGEPGPLAEREAEPVWDEREDLADMAVQDDAVSSSTSSHNSVSNTRPSRSNWLLAHPWGQFVVALITLPFNFVICTVYDVLKFFYELVIGERLPSVTNFREDVANFRRGVFESFGALEVEFFDGTFEEAFTAACDAEKAFAAYLFTPGSRYSEEMVQQVLTDVNFVETINNFNVVLWGVDPKTAQGRAGKRLMRVEMVADAQQVVPLLRQVVIEEMDRYEEDKFKSRMIYENRRLMKQQEREYRESEMRDRAMIAERRRQQEMKEAEEMKQQQEEKERQEKLAGRLQGLNEIREEINKKQLSGDYDGPDSIRVIVRYPSGDTTQHKFAPDENTMNLFEVIFSKPCCPNYFEALYGFPRAKLNFCPKKYHEIFNEHRVATGQETSEFVEPLSFKELGISSSLALFINDIDS
ncbi:unnamed protein product [Nippostrongylus brasiliensis]|uniref:UBX domain-containing protein n=1 Tax=Nippostrongylus brasiliensis TaxID=27835 RepID=A0A0N4Y088_NIPBR|nr:unnamed protein product [Nippostrongylus brasiliensis]